MDLLGCDAAPQWAGVTTHLAWGWIPAGRHYQQRWPASAAHRTLLEDCQPRCWAYYGDLRGYQAAPTAAARARLSTAVDEWFATRTGYPALDERIAKTRANRPALLQVRHPEVPLPHHPAALGARRRVRQRDVRFGPRTPTGARAWDTCLTLVATTRQLGLSCQALAQNRRGLTLGREAGLGVGDPTRQTGVYSSVGPRRWSHVSA